MPYYDLLIGFDATAFPSYYEPWGYTPLESVAFGVPTVTTSLSGFGQWVGATTENSFDDCGVCVIPRGDSDYDRVVASMAEALASLVASDAARRQRIARAARATADACGWAHFIEYYREAYAKASANNKKSNK